MSTNVFIRQRSRAYISPLAWLIVLMMMGSAEFFLGANPVADFLGRLGAGVLERNLRLAQSLEWPIIAGLSYQQSARRLQELEVEYALVLSELSQLEGVEAENQALRSLLENTDRPFQRTRVVTPLVSLARPALALGSAGGVGVGSEVVLNGVLLGTVNQVTANFAYLTLITQVDHQPVLAKTNQGVMGIVRGTGRGLVMEEVALDAAVDIGDRVVSVGQPGIGADFVIGRVVRVVGEPSSPVKSLELDQGVDFFQARIVEVVL